MRVLHITANYPTVQFPVFGIFVKEQVESLRNEGVDCEVFFSNGKENGGVKAHRASINKVRKLLRENHYDVIHCHHALSALMFICTLWPLFKKSVVSYQNDPTTEWKVMNVFGLVHVFFNRIIIKNQSEYLKKSKTAKPVPIRLYGKKNGVAAQKWRMVPPLNHK